MPSTTRKSSSTKAKKATKTKKPAEKKAPREKWVSPPIKTISEGKYEDYNQLYDNFNLPDLVEFCKQEGLKSTGKKKDVINRILHYRKTGEKEEPGASGTKRKRSASASGRSRSKSPAKKAKASPKKKEKESES